MTKLNRNLIGIGLGLVFCTATLWFLFNSHIDIFEVNVTKKYYKADSPCESQYSDFPSIDNISLKYYQASKENYINPSNPYTVECFDYELTSQGLLTLIAVSLIFPFLLGILLSRLFIRKTITKKDYRF